MRIFRALSVAAAAAIAAFSFGETILSPLQGLLAGTPDIKWASYTWTPSVGYKVAYPKKDAYFVIRLPSGTSFAGRTHIDIRATNNLPRPAQIEINVSSNNGQGWLTSLLVLGPNESADVTMPLFESEQYGLRALPTPTDTAAHQTRSLGSIFPNDIRGLYLYSKDTLPADVTFKYIALANHTVPLTGFVDTFGQQRLVSWTEKIKSVSEMQAKVGHEPDGQYPYAADEFGAVVGGKNYGAAERFRVEKDGDNWYLIAPSGNRFFSVGINEVGAHAWTPVSGREAMFTDLANLKAQYPTHFTTREGKLGFMPYAINLQRKFGSTWRTQAYDIFPKRMRSWGFNTVGVSSWDALMSQRDMPSTFGFNLWSPHPKLYVSGGRSMSDVFDPAFETAAKADITRRLTEVAVNHSQSIGVFIDNELPWGVGTSADNNKRYALAKAAINAPGTAANSKFMAQVKLRYGTIGNLNVAWKSTFSGWAALGAGAISLPSPGTPEMQQDLSVFTKRFALRYFQTIDRLIGETGYKGLYLGCRFTRLEYTTEVLSAAKASVDILSFNIYSGFPSRTNPDLKRMDFPVMISEFCFGASDRGRVGMPLYPTVTESSRIDAYRRFYNEAKSWKNLVGAHWYRWEDFPVTAKLDHDNMQEGLLSITDMTYSEFLVQTRKSTADHMNMLKLAP